MKYSQADAVISDDGLYRYTLTRHWGFGNRVLVFLMLNPSTADGEHDDATIRRCVGFAKREAYDGIVVVNLFAYRATNPNDLWALHVHDPVGVGNDRTLRAVAKKYRDIVCAWGVNAPSPRAEYVLHMLKTLVPEANLNCLGTTKAGCPKHPVRLASDTPFLPFGD